MERCTHCGINLAKVDPMAIIVESHVNPSDQNGAQRELELTGRQWCSTRCRDWTIQRDQARRGGEDDAA